MNTTELKDKFRLELIDAVAPYFWKDEEIYEYMNDAQLMFCRLVGGIQDSTSDITKIDVVIGQTFSPISPKLLKIRKAILASNYQDITLLNAEDLWDTVATDYGITAVPKLDNTTGPVRAIVLGMEQDQVRMLQIPEANDTINMVIYRLPLKDLDDADQKIEIAAHHHIYLLHWMKHRAFSKHDAETFDKTKAATFENMFIAYCDQARMEMETRKHKHRTVQYGGI